MTPVQTPAAPVTLLAFSNLFMTFAWYGRLKHLMLYMGEGLKLDYLWAALCLVGAVYFIFRP
jgi:uncharacterized protein (DUF486 family)